MFTRCCFYVSRSSLPLVVFLCQWNNVLLRRFFTIHERIALYETMQICLDKLYLLYDPPLYRFKDTVRVCYQKQTVAANRNTT